MDCPQCGQEYGHERLPRILTQCGHTMCELCLAVVFTEQAVTCSQCKRTTNTKDVGDLPVNLALMHLRDGQSNLCALHNKPMEAFCTSDQQMICVGCILEETHKRHEITSIPKAAASLRTSLVSLQSTVQIAQSLERKEREIATLEAALRQEYAQMTQSCTEFFTVIANTAKEKEAEMMQRLNSTLAVELERIRVVREANSRQATALTKLQRTITEIEAESDTLVLEKGREREELVRCASVKPLSLVHNKPFGSFNKEGELNAVWKVVKLRVGIETSAPPLSVSTAKPFPSVPKTDLKRVPTKDSPILPHTNRTKSQTGDPLRTSVNLAKSKTVLSFKPQQDEVNLTFDSYVPTEINSSVGFKGDFSPISKASASFLSVEEDNVSSKSLDLSAFCKVRSSCIFTFGGCSDRALSCVERFDPITEEWRAVAQLPSVRSQFACFQHPQRVTLLGGKISSKRVASSDDFLVSSSCVIDGSMRLPGIRSGFGLAVLQEGVYIVGGSDGVPLKSMEKWSGVEWSVGASMKVRRDELALVVGPDLQLYALGGYGGTDM